MKLYADFTGGAVFDITEKQYKEITEEDMNIEEVIDDFDEVARNSVFCSNFTIEN